MSITNGYATLAEFRRLLNIDDSDDDNELELTVEAASRAVDDYCDRMFYSASQTRYYTPHTAVWLCVDDLVSVTTLKTDAGGDGTFETTWTSGDYTLEPFNAAADSKPYRRVCRAHTSSRSFHPRVPRSVEIAGTFGWPAVPTAVKEATLLWATRLWRRGKDAPLGIVHLPGVDGAGGMRVSGKIDADVAGLLHDYRRHAVMVG